MSLSATVMAHPRRLAWAEDLAERLHCGITLDRISDRHETGLRCLQAGVGTGATHHVIIQDDAVICRDLMAGLERAVQVSGDRVVGLYVGNVRPQAAQSTARVKKAKAAGVSWAAMPGPWWGVGIVIPTVHLPALVAHYSKSREQNYDRRIEKWATSAKVECWYTMPSLVDHRHGEENPSLVADRTSLDRRARWFIGEDASALDIDWTLTPTPPVSVWRNRVSGAVSKARPGTSAAFRLEVSDKWEPVVEHRCEHCGGRGKWYEPVGQRVDADEVVEVA